MKLYIVLWFNSYEKKWAADSVWMDDAIADAKLKFERLSCPGRRYELVECTVPDSRVTSAVEAASSKTGNRP
jgi:hypothetical protein